MSDPSPTPQRRTVRVLESFVRPHPRANPYNSLLVRSFPPQVHAEWFSWRRALLGRYDVFHLHWPEVKLQGSTAWRSIARGVAFLALIVRLRLARRGVVRSLHDLRPHEPPSRVQRVLIALSERWTDVWIILNQDIRPPTGAPAVFAPIGDYREWFPPAPVTEPVPGRLLHFGLVRRYKGVDTLLSAFAELPDPDLSLRVVGSVQDETIRAELQRSSARDDRFTYLDDYVDDEALRDEVLAAELVILPFARITNSSSLIVALSLNRPVLAPAVGPILEVVAEVGDRWVITYNGELTPDVIERALEQLRRSPPDGSPDLSARTWERVGEAHAEAFALALERVRRR